MRRFVLTLLAFSAVAHADQVVPGDAVEVPVFGPFQHLPSKPCADTPPSLPVWGRFHYTEMLCKEIGSPVPGRVNLEHQLAFGTTQGWYVVPHVGESGQVLHEGLPMPVDFTVLGMRHLSTELLEVRYRQTLFGAQEYLLHCSMRAGRPFCSRMPFTPRAPR